MIAHDPVAVFSDEAWYDTLNQAAMQLLIGPADPLERLRVVAELLAGLHCDESRPEWARTALRAAVDIVADTRTVEACAGAQQRVAVLIELLVIGEEPQPAAAPVGTPEPTSPSAVPSEAARTLFPEFIEESSEYLGQAEAALLELEANAGAVEPVNVVFRAFHTIKSSAAFLGLEPLSVFAHDAETLLCPIRDGRVPFDAAHADIVLRGVDLMRELLAQARVSMEAGTFITLPAQYQPLRQRLAELARRDGEAPAATPAAQAASAPAQRSSTVATGDAHATSDGWTRVRTQRLDLLVDLMGELVVAQSMVAQQQLGLRERHGEMARRVAHTSKLVRELQQLSLSLHMVPMRPLFQRLHRLVRDTALRADKQVQLLVEGEDTEIDRTMVDALTDPLTHMLRNAIDHGIESVAERRACGKPPMGTIRLAASHSGGALVLELSDDGRGLDRDAIRAKALQRGVVAADQLLSEAQTDELIFAPGLSTAASVTEISGRGVGMDVVRRNIEGLHGQITIASEPGTGTRFTLRLPLTLAITEGMLVRVGQERYIVPTFSIMSSFRPLASALTTEAQGGELVMVQGRAVPVVRLHHVFRTSGAVTDPTAGLLVVIAQAQESYALLVDELLGQQQFVAKPVAGTLAEVEGVAGAAVLGDGRVGLILDAAGLLAVSRRVPPLEPALS